MCLFPAIYFKTISVEDSSNYIFKETRNKVDKYDEKIGYLKEFIGGLYTIFSGTYTVESDFSVIAYDKKRLYITIIKPFIRKDITQHAI